MCGLFGWQWKPGKEPSAASRGLLAAILSMGNDKRGGDSWGYLELFGNAPLKAKTVTKGMGHIVYSASQFAELPGAMAHCRFATTGSKVIGNSHPFFAYGKDNRLVIGAHNGIVSNHDELNKKYNRSCLVDSHHIFMHIAEERDLGELRTYGAVTFVKDETPGRVYMCRFNSGQFAMANLSEGVVWSSDKDHLKEALRVANLKEKHFFEVDDKQLLFVEDGEAFDSKEKLQFGEREWRTAYSYNGSSGTYSSGGRTAGATNEDRWHWRQGHYQSYNNKDQSFTWRCRDGTVAPPYPGDSRPTPPMNTPSTGTPPSNGGSPVIVDKAAAAAPSSDSLQMVRNFSSEQRVMSKRERKRLARALENKGQPKFINHGSVERRIALAQLCDERKWEYTYLDYLSGLTLPNAKGTMVHPSRLKPDEVVGLAPVEYALFTDWDDMNTTLELCREKRLREAEKVGPAALAAASAQSKLEQLDDAVAWKERQPNESVPAVKGPPERLALVREAAAKQAEQQHISRVAAMLQPKKEEEKKEKTVDERFADVMMAFAHGGYVD